MFPMLLIRMWRLTMLKVSLPPSLQELTQLCDTDVGCADCLYHKQVEVIFFHKGRYLL